MGYFAPESWYQPDEMYDILDTSEYVHRDELLKYDDAAYYLEEVINQLYNIGDIGDLEDSLEELAKIFDLKLPKKQPKLIVQEDEIYDLKLKFVTSTVNLPKIGVLR